MASLESYLSEHGLTQDAFGALVGVSGVSVHRWLRGASRPSWENIAAIERVTGGAVQAADFVPRQGEAA